MDPLGLKYLTFRLVLELIVQRNIAAPCQAVGRGSVIAIEWTKDGLDLYCVRKKMDLIGHRGAPMSHTTHPDVSPYQRTITAEPGQTITLPCQVTDSGSVILVEWTRDGLEPSCVLLYMDFQFNTDLQHISYKNRVDLQDRQMKGGDVSLILRNVTTADRGTYECRVIHHGKIRSDLANTPNSINHLVVSRQTRAGNRGSRAGPAGLMVGLTLVMRL